MENRIIDKKLKCCSIMRTMKISEYLELVEKAYVDRGGIQGQREPLKQKTAITIRKRMINDIKEGTILPPVVIGVIVSNDEYELSKKCDDVIEFLKILNNPRISIIDGMQRTTAIVEAVEEKESVAENQIRVELWISCEVNSLLYRMLVLNTGQVPWNMRRQVELIFDNVITQIKERLSEIEILKIDDKQRRSKAGQYAAKDLIEMFMAFGARTWKIDTKERVTDEFTRGDLVQSSEETNMVETFCEILELMYKWDLLLDQKIVGGESNENTKFKRGKDLFSGRPAKIGFAAACGEYIFGRPGEKRTADIVEAKNKAINDTFEKLFVKMDECEDVEDMIDLQTLEEVMDVKSVKVGDYEREKFYSAFKVLLETQGEIESLTVCWRA